MPAGRNHGIIESSVHEDSAESTLLDRPETAQARVRHTPATPAASSQRAFGLVPAKSLRIFTNRRVTGRLPFFLGKSFSIAMAMPRKAVSAPGKVFLAGGYLVLDRKYTALVFGLSARFHVSVQPLPTTSGVSLSEIIVKSPQFKDALWEYGYRLVEESGGIQVTQLRGSASEPLHRNPFVETALTYALTYVSSLTSRIVEPASIYLLADNDYYSRPADEAGAQLAQKGRFINFGVPIWDAHKTGLGSSAALVTAFTAAILTYYLPEDVFSLSTESGRSRLHNLAQAAHCAAQGKVGSGFDVASAVYGSCLYRRFSPSILESCGDAGSQGFATRLKQLVEDSGDAAKWDTQITKSAIKIPSGLRLVMCDVDCGSQTPGMVKKVLAWRKENPETANALWDELQSSNEALAAELVLLAEGKKQDYGSVTGCLNKIRTLIRSMSEQSGVPVEPKEQTELLDACSKVPGVLGGVVPGAGGYDAIVLLVEDKPEVLKALGNFLADWNASSATRATESQVGKVGILGVREEMEGIRVEEPIAYDAWIR